MIIKDNEGDWAICSAAWVGMAPGKPGTPGKPGIPGTRTRAAVKGVKGTKGVPGKPGYFKMWFFNLRTKKSESITLPAKDGKNRIYGINQGKMHVEINSCVTA